MLARTKLEWFYFHLFFQIESLKVDLGKKDAALTASETKLQTLKAHQSNQQEHIAVLQTSLSAKEHHIKNLQGEVRVTCSKVIFYFSIDIIGIELELSCSVVSYGTSTHANIFNDISLHDPPLEATGMLYM